jgi:hypothetical protein
VPCKIDIVMLRLAIFCGILVVAGAGISALAQLCQASPEMRDAVENLDFSHGRPDSAPPGWFLNGNTPPRTPSHEALTAWGASCSDGRQCGVVRDLRDGSSARIAFLYQVINATQYRGKRLTYRAKVRVEAKFGSVARLLVRVHRTDCSTSFRGDMGDHPITAGTWSTYEIRAPIALDARDVEFGMQLVGPGAAWIDGVSMTYSDAER